MIIMSIFEMSCWKRPWRLIFDTLFSVSKILSSQNKVTPFSTEMNTKEMC